MSAYSGIELLGWLPATERLKASLERAFTAAAQAGQGEAEQREVEIEHILAAFLEDIDANVYLATRNVDREELRKFCISQIGEAGMPAADTALPDTALPQEDKTKNESVATPSTAGTEAIEHPTPSQPAEQSAYPASSPQTAYASSTSQPSSYTGTSTEHSSHHNRDTPTQGYSGGATSPSTNNSYSYNRDSWSHSALSSPYHRPKTYGDTHSASSVRSSSAFGAHSTSSAYAQPANTSTIKATNAYTSVNPKPSAALRRMMAQASDLTEAEGRDEIDSETVVRAIAVDTETNSGRFLRGYLKIRDIGEASIGRKAADARAEEIAAAHAAAEQAAQQARHSQTAAEQQPAFDVIVKRSETIMQLLQRELQKDIRYRLANDLTDFLSARETGALVAHEGSHLRNSAHPILHAAESELRSDPNFQAHEQLRNTLRAINVVQRALQDRLLRLQDVHGDSSPIVKAVQQLVDLQSVVDRHEAPYQEATSDTASYNHSQYKTSEQTLLEQTSAAMQPEPQNEYYDASYVMVDEDQQHNTTVKNVDANETLAQTTTKVSKEKKQSFFRQLFSWRKVSAAAQQTHETQMAYEEHNNSVQQEAELTTATATHNASAAGDDTTTAREWEQTQDQSSTETSQTGSRYANKHNTSRSTLLHTSTIAFTLIAAGAVALALTANSILY